jgi:predicted ABC-type ATPase
MRDERVFVVDPDAIARERDLTSIGAGRKAIEIIRAHLKAARSFSVETTLSGHSHLTMIDEAQALGYRIELNYVGTNDVSINLERIRSRVAAGGHDVPEVDVRRRYERSLRHAQSVVRMADYVMLLDNSGAEMTPIIEREHLKILVYRDTPPWATAITNALRAT